eukprot:30470-Lingulodinium_polyedra.AAC.1
MATTCVGSGTRRWRGAARRPSSLSCSTWREKVSRPLPGRIGGASFQNSRVSARAQSGGLGGHVGGRVQGA